MGDASCCQKISKQVPARVVLGGMAFLGFMVTQMLRSNLYIAVVAMVRDDNDTTTQNYGQRVSWGDGAEGLVLSAFYWSYWLSELPGGVLAQRFGPRGVLSVATSLAGLLSLALPAACRAGAMSAAVVRVAQGLALGVTWPAMHCLSGRWIPAMERSKFMSSYHGAAVGNALTFPLSGVVIARFGWPWVFYSTGGLALVWSVLWWVLIRDSPEQHPRISDRERRYLTRTLNPTPSRRAPTPWSLILTSAPCWAVMWASQGLMWGTITLSMQLPAYFTQVHHLDIQTNGLLSGIPDICKCGFGFAFSALTDWLLKTKRLTLTTARKLAVATCEILPAILLAVLAVYGGQDARLAALILACSSALGGASSSGSLANIVDLSPNFAGAILGLIKTLSMFPGVLSPMVAATLTKHSEGEDANPGWTHLFLLTSGVYVFCCVIFLVLGSGKVQPWDTPPLSQNKFEPVAEEQDVTQPLNGEILNALNSRQIKM